MVTKIHTRLLMVLTAAGVFVLSGCSATKNISEPDFHYFDRGLHYVSQLTDGGKFILLEDQSLWEVDSFDEWEVHLWQHVDEIRVVQSFGGDNPYYPYTLINLRRGGSVEAKLLSKR